MLYGSSGVDGQNQGQHSGGLAGITVGDNALNKLILVEQEEKVELMKMALDQGKVEMVVV